jgi:hypothetical protein
MDNTLGDLDAILEGKGNSSTTVIDVRASVRAFSEEKRRRFQEEMGLADEETPYLANLVIDLKFGPSYEPGGISKHDIVEAVEEITDSSFTVEKRKEKENMTRFVLTTEYEVTEGFLSECADKINSDKANFIQLLTPPSDY